MLSYKFPVVKGVQAKKEYFICMIPLGIISKIFLSSDSGGVAPEFRAQRKLNEARIPEIRDYILGNRDSYVFSALAASVDGTVTFISTGIDSNLGVLEIPMDASFLINDGQHRKAAIQAAIDEDDSLREETIPVVLFKDSGLEKSQQMFTDLNKHAVITSKSLNALYESKDSVAVMTKKLINKIDFLRKYTDKEKDNLGKFSSNIFTLNSIVSANKRIFRDNIESVEAENFLFEFWNNVVLNMKDWNDMDKGELSKVDLRENYIVTQGVTIHALGRLGQFFYENQDFCMTEILSKLNTIDWLRNNTKTWIGRAVKHDGKINRNEQGIFLTYLQIKRMLGLPITVDEKKKEKI